MLLCSFGFHLHSDRPSPNVKLLRLDSNGTQILFCLRFSSVAGNYPEVLFENVVKNGPLGQVIAIKKILSFINFIRFKFVSEAK